MSPLVSGGATSEALSPLSTPSKVPRGGGAGAAATCGDAGGARVGGWGPGGAARGGGLGGGALARGGAPRGERALARRGLRGGHPAVTEDGDELAGVDCLLDGPQLLDALLGCPPHLTAGEHVVHGRAVDLAHGLAHLRVVLVALGVAEVFGVVELVVAPGAVPVGAHVGAGQVP